ncbi:hypothetical protein BH24ACT4_BH24ACT4_09410 [soil metagenome]
MLPTLRTRRRPVLAALAGLLLLGSLGCSDSGDDTTTTDTTSAPTETSTTTDTDPTSSEPDSSDPTAETTAPGAPSQPTAYTATAEDAVNELKAAWREGDRARAEAIAPGDVVDALFGVPAENFEVYGCDTGEFPTSTCNYRNRGTGVFIKVDAARSDAGWQISSITVA